MVTSWTRIFTVPFVLFEDIVVDVGYDGGAYTAIARGVPLAVGRCLTITLEFFVDNIELLKLSESILKVPLEKFVLSFTIEKFRGFL